MASGVAANITGEALRDARERAHLSQKDAADRIGVGLRTYERWESDRPTVPYPRHRQALTKFLAELAAAQEVAA